MIFTCLILLTVEYVPNVWFTRFLCLLIGTSLYSSLVCSVQTCATWLLNKQDNPMIKNGCATTLSLMIIGISLLLTTLFSWLSDHTYYLNRNITYWVRIIIGVTIALITLLSAPIQTCLLQRKRKTSDQ